MKLPNSLYRLVALGALTLAFSILAIQQLQAGGGHFYPPVQDKLVLEECGSCHLAFPAAMLPVASWQRMMTELDQHFGEDLSLDETRAEHIGRYLTQNAADAAGQPYSRKLMKGVRFSVGPQRITELPKWVRKHRKVPDWEWQRPEVVSKVNCLACHPDAESGYYQD